MTLVIRLTLIILYSVLYKHIDQLFIRTHQVLSHHQRVIHNSLHKAEFRGIQMADHSNSMILITLLSLELHNYARSLTLSLPHPLLSATLFQLGRTMVVDLYIHVAQFRFHPLLPLVRILVLLYYTLMVLYSAMELTTQYLRRRILKVILDHPLLTSRNYNGKNTNMINRLVMICRKENALVISQRMQNKSVVSILNQTVEI